jgi:adenosine deaminase
MISHATIAALPKIELHRHLEGSLRLTTLAEVNREFHLGFPEDDLEVLRGYVQITDEGGDYRTFLSKFTNLRRFYQTPELIRRYAYEAVADAAADNIRYMELRFTPMALARVQNYSLADVTGWVIEAVEQAQRDFPIKVRLIVNFNRHEDVSVAQRCLEIAIANRERGVVGIDMGGDEANFSAEPFTQLFFVAQEAGLGVTVHAGEWAGVQNVLYAIEMIGASRIGHGVKVMDNSNALALARERGTVFEVCVTSNVQSGVFQRFIDHPLRVMFDRGLKITLNTDDPCISNITLGDEWHIVTASMGFDLNDLKQMILCAVEATFLPPLEKLQLMQQFKEELGLK